MINERARRKGENEILLEVEEDGIGFTPEKLAQLRAELEAKSVHKIRMCEIFIKSTPRIFLPRFLILTVGRVFLVGSFLHFGWDHQSYTSTARIFTLNGETIGLAII